MIWNKWCHQVIVIMIWYKSSIQERPTPLRAKMGRRSPVCQEMREQIIEMFKNNVSQRKIGRDLDISPSTVHNIIKRFKESGWISVRKGQGHKPTLNNRDLRSLRRHSAKKPSFIYKQYNHTGSGLLWHGWGRRVCGCWTAVLTCPQYRMCGNEDPVPLHTLTLVCRKKGTK